MEKKRTIVNCDGCGLPLVHRLGNGTLEFVFGGSGKDSFSGAPLVMRIQGTVEMKCFRKKCRCWNTISSE